MKRLEEAKGVIRRFKTSAYTGGKVRDYKRVAQSDSTQGKNFFQINIFVSNICKCSVAIPLEEFLQPLGNI